MDLAACPAKGPYPPSLEPTVALGVATSLLFRLVVLVAVQLYRHRGSADQHQEVESIGPVNALDPRLDGEDQTGFPQLLVEGDLDRRQVVSVDLFKRNRTGRWFVEWQVADSGMSGCSPRRRQSWPSIGGVADTGQTSMFSRLTGSLRRTRSLSGRSRPRTSAAACRESGLRTSKNRR